MPNTISGYMLYQNSRKIAYQKFRWTLYLQSKQNVVYLILQHITNQRYSNSKQVNLTVTFCYDFKNFKVHIQQELASNSKRSYVLFVISPVNQILNQTKLSLLLVNKTSFFWIGMAHSTVNVRTHPEIIRH